LSGQEKAPEKRGLLKFEACFEGYFVEGAGVEAVSAAVFVVVLFVSPLCFVTFLCFFFVVCVPVEVGTSVVVEDLSIVAPVAGFVVVEGPVCVVVVACWAKATPNDRREAATRAEMVFFIFSPIPCFCGRFGAYRQCGQRNPAASARPTSCQSHKGLLLERVSRRFGSEPQRLAGTRLAPFRVPLIREP
jgi:hypothetical protein